MRRQVTASHMLKYFSDDLRQIIRLGSSLSESHTTWSWPKQLASKQVKFWLTSRGTGRVSDVALWRRVHASSLCSSYRILLRHRCVRPGHQERYFHQCTKQL